ncbi:MAG: hypothetical protein GY856_22560, partial [bacterium]|nr:hypothetical protein [bacterium]
LDVDVAAVDDQVEVIDGKLDDAQSEADDQAEFLTAFQDLALQLRIEADLIRDGDERISLFQLPDGAGTVGGYLEIVHAIVEEAIVQRAAAGRNLGHGPEYFALASRLYSEEAYKKAYTEYRNAYRELLAVQ